MKKVIGLDIGGTSSKFGLVEGSSLLSRGTLPTCLTDDPADFVKRLKVALEPLEGASAIGIGAPNGNHLRGTVELAPNLTWKGIVPLARMIEDSLGIPARLTNDANAAALGEMQFGAARGMKNIVMITLGTGLGSGFIVDGKLVIGHSGFAGELGQVTVEKNGRLCGCGRRGCLETYVSATGIVTTARELLKEFPASSLHKRAELSALVIAEEAQKGDTLALQAFDFTAELLARALANTAAITSPEAIFIFGGLSRAGELLMGPLQKHFDGMLHNIFRGSVKIMRSGLPDGDAAILGAASLVL